MAPGRSLLVCLVALASAGACASASVADGDGDGGGEVIDAPPGGGDARVDAPLAIDAMLPIDAMPIDAPPAVQTITLSQSSVQTITSLNSVACSVTATGVTRENSYYRVFRLSDFGVNTAFTATRVDVGIEEATAGAGTSQAIQVRLYTLNGAFQLANLTAIAGQTVTVANASSLSVIQVPLAPAGIAPAGSTLVAEVFVPDGMAANNIFFIGSNAAAETGPSYIRAPTCNATQPATFASLQQPQVHIVLTVTGTY